MGIDVNSALTSYDMMYSSSNFISLILSRKSLLLYT